MRAQSLRRMLSAKITNSLRHSCYSILAPTRSSFTVGPCPSCKELSCPCPLSVAGTDSFRTTSARRRIHRRQEFKTEHRIHVEASNTEKAGQVSTLATLAITDSPGRAPTQKTTTLRPSSLQKPTPCPECASLLHVRGIQSPVAISWRSLNVAPALSPAQRMDGHDRLTAVV